MLPVAWSRRQGPGGDRKCQTGCEWVLPHTSADYSHCQNCGLLSSKGAGRACKTGKEEAEEESKGSSYPHGMQMLLFS